MKKFNSAQEIFDFVMTEGFNVNFDKDAKCKGYKANVSDSVAKSLINLSSRSHDGGKRQKLGFDLSDDCMELTATVGTYKGTLGEVHIQAVKWKAA